MSETTLFDYWRSSAAYRARIALNLLGISYNSIAVNLLEGAHREPDYLEQNPQGLVPTLLIDGLRLTQSLAIIEYLHETRPGAGLLPPNAIGRARVRALSYAIAMEMHAPCNMSVSRRAVAISSDTITMQDWMQPFIASGFAALEIMLDHQETGRFCHGDQVTMADICLMPQVYNARRWEVDLAPTPIVERIAASLATLPAFAAAYPQAPA